MSSPDLMDEVTEPELNPGNPPGARNALSRIKQVIKIIAWPLGLILIVLAAIYGINLETLGLLWIHMQWWQLPIWIAVLCLNLISTGLLFWRMNRLFEKPDRPIPAIQMILVITASTLLNYLPFPKAGLVARALYLNKKYDIAYSATAGVFGMMFIHATCLFILLACVTIALPLSKALEIHWSLILSFGVVLFALLQLALLPLIKFKLKLNSWWSGVQELVWWSGLRVVDLSALLIQVWLAFHWMGITLNPVRLISIVAARSILGLSGITPNGIGLTEWAGSYLASSDWMGHGTNGQIESDAAITAMLLYQLMAMLFFIPLGALALGWLKRDLRKLDPKNLQ